MTDNNTSLESLLQAIRRESASLEAQQILEPAAPRAVESAGCRDEPLPAHAAITTGGVPVLLAIPDAATFIESAYRQLLQRPADPAGKAHHIERLARGTSRSRLLFDLYTSAEAAACDTTPNGIETLIRPYRSRWLKRYPRILNWLTRTLEAYLRASPASLAAAQTTSALQSSIMQANKVMETFRQEAKENRLATMPVKGKLHMLELELDRLRMHSNLTPARQTENPLSTPETEAFYLAFENACRGPEDEIRRQFTDWLKHLPSPGSNNPRVLDIGCGRGEWLQLLAANGYQATGLDTNAVMVQHCQRKQLDVQLGDAFDWLQQQPDNSLCAITAFHVIEHIPFSQLLQWTQEAYRVLQPGGVLIYETPNPENILVASHTFYHDPTHRNPLTPTLLEFLAEYCGFKQPELVRLHPYPESARLPGDDPVTARINGHFCGPQDIGLVAAKPMEPACA